MSNRIPNHYATLGIVRSATSQEIKSAYRKLVLQHHPDHSTSPESEGLFIEITQAYQVLIDPDSRKQYHAQLEAEARAKLGAGPKPTGSSPSPQAQARTGTNQSSSRPSSASNRGKGGSQTPSASASSVAADVSRLSMIFSRGQYAEAEKLALQIVQRDPRQPIPYAVLGDLSRGKGNLDDAAKMYAYAAQMDPRNPVYQQRHEELIYLRTRRQDLRTQVSEEGRSVVAMVVGALLMVSAAFYVILAKEPAILPQFSPISTWTLGLVVMLFLVGVCGGSVLSVCNLLDRFHTNTNSLGKVSASMIALSSVAIVNFWAAFALFLGISAAQRGSNINHLRFLLSVAVSTILLSLASMVSQSTLAPMQVLIWGGNLSYIGGLCGWMVADSFKRVGW